MTKKELINIAYKLDTGDEKTLFISKFEGEYEMEIVALISAWLSNGVRNEDYVIRYFVSDVMCGYPTSFITDYAKRGRYDISGDACFLGILTYRNLHNLLRKSYDIWCCHGGLYNEYEIKYSDAKYSHEAFASILSGGTGFPSINANGTFYRYNLLLYWLSYKFKSWYDITPFLDKAILPCNDKIFGRAYELGVVDKLMKPTLKNAITLTHIARDWFGDENFYKMYELLNFYG